METEIRRVLIIDDNSDYRKALTVRLNSLFPHADITEYDFPGQGLPATDFNWKKYDLLILDYHLGEGETGLNWFKKYKKSVFFPATLIITGMDDNETAALVLKTGVHYFLSKKQLTKNKMYESITKALSVRASMIAEYKSMSNHEYDFDAFIAGFLIRTEERLTAEIVRDSNKSGHFPNKPLLDAKLKLEYHEIRNSNDEQSIREAKIGLMEVVTERIRDKSW